MTAKSKNVTLRNHFVQYCIDHPQERFWQALRNWSPWNFIIGINDLSVDLEQRISDSGGVDTFHLEENPSPRDLDMLMKDRPEEERTIEILKIGMSVMLGREQGGVAGTGEELWGRITAVAIYEHGGIMYEIAWWNGRSRESEWLSVKEIGWRPTDPGSGKSKVKLGFLHVSPNPIEKWKE